ncbi:MAG TPA: FimV/HubP family polar landmark protein, partial [Steroidobacteraceae bacterium]
DTMLIRNCYRVLLLVLLLPSASMALGLGEIHLKSALNAPLDADIDVVGASAEELSGLKANLASRDAFVRYGLDYPAYLSGVTLEPQKTADGRTVIHLRSADAVNEPIASMLVEVNWARGHLVREYTVLLDPPVFSGDASSAAAANVAAPATAESAHSGNVQRHVPSASAPTVSSAGSGNAPSSGSSAASGSGASGSPSASAAPKASPSSGSATRGPTSAGGSYTVRSGDTLTGITAQAYGAGDKAARQRELVAVYRANTSAFDGNMNLLRAGSRLSLPGDAEITAISPGEAAAEVHKQYSAWNSSHGASAAASGTSGTGQLRLVPPQESAQAPANTAAAAAGSNAATGNAAPAHNNPSASEGATNAASAAAAAGMQQRVTQLEAQLAESQRLLQLKNSELAALQAHSAAPSPAAPSAPPPAAAPTPAPAATPAPTPPAPVASAPPPAEAPPATPPTAKPTVTPAPAAGASGNSFIDLAKEYWYLPAGLVAVLLILLIVRAVRARQEDAFDRSLGRLSQPGFDSKPAEQPRISDTVPVRALAPAREEQSYRVEESGTHEQPSSLVAKGDTSVSGRHVAIDENVTGEAPVALDQGDPLAEADFHMAYGLYDQAADLVQIAISREPQRRDLRLKLLEVFFVWGNKDRFLASARELASTRDKALPGEWEKIVIMGRQIAPEDPLFGSSGALPGVTSGGVDLNLEGGQNRIDFDLMGEPTVSAPSTGGIDLDLGKALGDPDATNEARAGGDGGVDFVFDDAERGNEQTGSTREMPARAGAGTTVTVQVPDTPGNDADAPTVEQPQLPGGDHPTIRQKIDAAARSGMASSEQTAELELHDLGLDLGPMDAVGDDSDLGTGADAPTMVAGLDDETRQLLARTDSERDDKTVRVPSAPGEPTDSGTWLFTDTDFADVMARGAAEERSGGDAPTEVVTQLAQRPELLPDADTGSTARLAALESDGVDLDLGDLNKSGTGRNGVDLDVGTPSSSSEGTFVQTQRIMAEDIPLPDLEPATMSEVGTKLDLARAYMDMGDPEGARSILSEVLSEGSVSQKQEARRLIDTLPG